MSIRLVPDRMPGSRRSSVRTGSRWVAAQSSEPLRQPFVRQYDRHVETAGTADVSGSATACGPPPGFPSSRTRPGTLVASGPLLVATAAPVSVLIAGGDRPPGGSTESSDVASPHRHRAI